MGERLGERGGRGEGEGGGTKSDVGSTWTIMVSWNQFLVE